MQVKQIVIEFIAVEDRLLMSIHADGPSVRVWLTRRYVRLLQSALTEVLNEQLNVSQPLTAGSRTLLAELVHEQAISTLDLATPPLSSNQNSDVTEINNVNSKSGDESIDAWLAFQLRTLWDEQDKSHRKATGISILPQLGDGITLNLDEKLPHALVEMLARACESAQWDLDFEALGVNARSNHISQNNIQLH